ncbi:MAG: lipopolysaccharide biosynthesis protein [Bdellovibrio sp.]
MKAEKKAFNRIVLLTGARIFGVIFSFIIPMYLGRHLAIESYGTYKLIMLIYSLAQLSLNLGFDDSVNYFLRWDKKNFALYSLNALIFNLFTTGLIATLLAVFRFKLAHLLNDPELAKFLPLLGLLIVLTISSQQLEVSLINLDHFKERLYLDASTELLKACSILAGFIFFDSLTVVLMFLCALMLIKLFWAIGVIHFYRNKEAVRYRDARRFFSKQAKFGIPLGISRIVQNILNMENLLISSFFNVVQFTFYAVGSFDNPFVNSLRASIYEFINMELVEHVKNRNYEGIQDTWRKMTRKLFLVVIPFTTYMAFFARELIVFVFSEKYASSASFFTIFNIFIFISCFNPEPLFRASSKTAVIFRIRIAGVILGLLMMFAGASLRSPISIMWAKILAVGFINFYGLFTGTRLLQIKLHKLFLWKDMVKLFSLSFSLSFLLRFVFHELAWHPFWILAASFSIYFLGVYLGSCAMNLIKEDESAYLHLLLRKGLAKVGLFKWEAVRD